MRAINHAAVLWSGCCWLRWDCIRVVRQLVFNMKPIASRIDNRRRHEDHEIFLRRFIGLAPEKAPQQRNVSQDRDFVLGLADILTNQTAEHHRLAIPDYGAGDDLPDLEFWQRQHRRKRRADGASRDGLSLGTNGPGSS